MGGVGQIPARRGKPRPTGTNPADSATVLGLSPAASTYSTLNKILLGPSGVLIRVHFDRDFVRAGERTIPLRFPLMRLRRDQGDDEGLDDDVDENDANDGDTIRKRIIFETRTERM